MTLRLIRKLNVHATVRQVDANEASAWRYVGFLAVLAGGITLIQIVVVSEWVHAGTAMTIMLVLVALLVFRPWHRHLRVDMDAKQVVFQWRFLGVVPVHSRKIDLAERLLGTGLVGMSDAGKQAQPDLGAGCLMLALPFPLSLLAVIFGGGKSEPRVTTWTALCVMTPTRDFMDDITELKGPEVAVEFLDAVREILPGCVAAPEQ